MRWVLGIVCNLAIVGSSPAQFAEQWSRHFIVTGAVYTAASAVGLDGAGNIHLAGLSSVGDYSSQLYVAKLNGSGTQQWLREFDPTPNVQDFISGMAVHSDGTVYLAGTADYGVETWLHVIAPDGNVQRHTNLNLGSISGLKTDSSGNLYLSGFNWSAAGTESDYDIASYFLRKEAANGELLWAHSIPVGGHSVSYGQGLALDAAGNPYTARVVDGRMLVSKFDVSGHPLWQTRYNGPFVGPYAPIMEADSSGNLFMIAGGETPVLVKFDAAGVQQWSTRIHSPSYASVLLPLEHHVLFGTRSLHATTDGLTRPAGTLNDNSGFPLNYSYPVWLLRMGPGELLFVETQSGYDETETNYTERVSLRRYEMNNSLPTEPSVEILARSQTRRLGESVTLAASGSSTGLFSYQWFRDAPTALLEGETNSTITIQNLSQVNVGAYWVLVRDEFGEVSSREVVIDAFLPPSDRKAVLGQSVVFNASCYQTAPRSVQWFHNGGAVPGRTNESLVFTNLTTPQAGTYRVVYQGAFGDMHEADVQLEVSDQVRLEWSAALPDFDCKGLVIDAAENISVVGTSWEGMRAAAFNSNGTLLTSFYCATGGYDFKPYAHAIASDAEGNIFISGGQRASGGYNYKVHLFHYSPKLETQHWARITSHSSYGVSATHLRADEGAAYHALRSKQRRTSRHDQYSSSRWTGSTNGNWLVGGGGDSSSEYLDDLQPGRNGDVYLLVRSYPNYGYGRPQLMRVRREGGLLWKLDLFTNGVSHGKLAVDSVGNVFAAGYAATNGYLLAGVGVMKFAMSSNVLWQVRYQDSTNVFGANAVTVDGADNLLIATDGATLKYDRAGRLLWVSATAGEFVQTDTAGNIYLARNIYTPWVGHDVEVTKLDPSGARKWQLVYDSPEKLDDVATGLAVSPAGNVYVTGTSSGNLLLIKYSSQTSSNAPAMPELLASMQVSPGSRLTLRAGDGIGNSYQWFFNGTAIPGATSALLEIPNFGADLAGGYSVEVQNAFGSVMTPETWVTPLVRLTPFRNAQEAGWSFSARSRFRYEVQQSSNLQDWTTFQTYSGLDGVVPVFLKPSNAERAFYRVHVPR